MHARTQRPSACSLFVLCLLLCAPFLFVCVAAIDESKCVFLRVLRVLLNIILSSTSTPACCCAAHVVSLLFNALFVRFCFVSIFFLLERKSWNHPPPPRRNKGQKAPVCTCLNGSGVRYTGCGWGFSQQRGGCCFFVCFYVFVFKGVVLSFYMGDEWGRRVSFFCFFLHTFFFQQDEVCTERERQNCRKLSRRPTERPHGNPGDARKFPPTPLTELPHENHGDARKLSPTPLALPNISPSTCVFPLSRPRRLYFVQVDFFFNGTVVVMMVVLFLLYLKSNNSSILGGRTGVAVSCQYYTKYSSRCALL